MTRSGEKVLVYHGTTSDCSESIKSGIMLHYSRRDLDFGPGFYVTPYLQQAIRWSEFKKERHNGKRGNIRKKHFVEQCVLEFELELADPLLNNFCFDTASEDWANFVLYNRTKNGRHEYDIVEGPVADGHMAYLLLQLTAGEINEQQFCQAILPKEKYKNEYQFSLHTIRALKTLKFIKEVDLGDQREKSNVSIAERRVQ